jgi:hypothetical protein
MAESVSREVLRRVRKLAQLPREARESQFGVSVTRLTVLKSLCREPKVATRFVTHIARKTLWRAEHGRDRPSHPKGATARAHRDMMAQALAGMEAWQRRPTEELREELLDLLGRMRAEQDEYKNIAWGAVRIVTDWELLLFEHALRCVLSRPQEAGFWAYQMARDYAERFDSRHGNGLTPRSPPLLQDIADFWVQELGLDAESINAPAKAKPARAEPPAPNKPSRGAAARRKKARFTHRQGQFLAFIHLYHKLHRQGPAELDMVQYFRLTPPSVHDMVVRLEQRGLVTREQGVPRSVRVAIPDEEIPPLEDAAKSPW